ncbi:hypothetical protein CCACVL1_05341 [Corchorus capsularis]|uniref:Uncharacterized protein n=1 Tax=Corchorus capsularis TaxID=210143 RepID=A0A1R3JLE8_COCAP|nr:hypothetical protein CCACVL1_05341 [Corchorus capsularis]
MAIARFSSSPFLAATPVGPKSLPLPRPSQVIVSESLPSSDGY